MIRMSSIKQAQRTEKLPATVPAALEFDLFVMLLACKRAISEGLGGHCIQDHVVHGNVLQV